MLLSIAVCTAFSNSQPIDEIFGGPALKASTIYFEAFDSLIRFFASGLCSACLAQFPLGTFWFRRLVASGLSFDAVPAWYLSVSSFGCFWPLFCLFDAVPAWYLLVPSFSCFWPLVWRGSRLVPFGSVVWLRSGS